LCCKVLVHSRHVGRESKHLTIGRLPQSHRDCPKVGAASSCSQHDLKVILKQTWRDFKVPLRQLWGNYKANSMHFFSQT
jgi:hypothetical protein